jgi:hypothetical protein
MIDCGHTFTYEQGRNLVSSEYSALPCHLKTDFSWEANTAKWKQKLCNCSYQSS